MKKERGKLTTTTKTWEYGQFETTVRLKDGWMDGWMERLNEEGDYLSLVLFFR